MSTLHLPLERDEWTEIEIDQWLTTKHKDSTRDYLIDFSNTRPILDGGTISTVTASAQGVTVDASGVTSGDGGSSTAVSLTVSDTDGYVDLTVTFSDSQVFVRRLMFRGLNFVADRESDYGR